MKTKQKTVKKSKKDHELAVRIAGWFRWRRGLRNVANLHDKISTVDSQVWSLPKRSIKPVPLKNGGFGFASRGDAVRWLYEEVSRQHWVAVQHMLAIAQHPNPPALLQQIAEELKGKLRSQYDQEIDDAYDEASLEAMMNVDAKGDSATWVANCYPTFAEFRKKYPRTGTDRSLRRTLNRHRKRFREGKLGRPSKNGTQNPR